MWGDRSSGEMPRHSFEISLELFSFKRLMCLIVLEVGALDEQVCLLEACSALFSLILELSIEAVIYHVALM